MGQKDHSKRSLGIIGSGNVFADLGLPNPEDELLKSKLVAKISEVIEARNLTQIEAGQIMGLAQPKVSDLCKGRFQAYSIDRLYRYLARLGVNISITLKNQPDWSEGEIEVLEAPQQKRRRTLAPAM